MDILSFHNDMIQNILRNLSPKDLAAVSLQCRRLRLLADESPVWEEQCRHRWTNHPYCIPWTWVDEGAWAKTYRQLAALDDNVVRSVGDSCEAHGDWSEIGIPDPESIHGVHVPQEFGTFILMAVLDVGTNAYKSADCLQSYAVALLRRDLCRWLSTAPHVVLALGEHLRELMVPFDPWADPAHGVMEDISWRRSAIEFLPQVVGPGPPQHAAVLRELAREMRQFDADLRAEMKAAPLELPGVPPDVMPRSHWWWRIDPALGPVGA